MDFTGDKQTDLQTISTYTVEQIKDILDEYDKYTYSLVLTNYSSRDQEYKNRLFRYIILINNIPEEFQVETIEYFLNNGANIKMKVDILFLYWLHKIVTEK